jgi:hypothetical protein
LRDEASKQWELRDARQKILLARKKVRLARKKVLLAQQQGLQQGLQEGRQEGKQEGRQEGRQEQARLTVKQLLALGRLTMAEIAQVTGISLAELQPLWFPRPGEGRHPVGQLPTFSPCPKLVLKSVDWLTRRMSLLTTSHGSWKCRCSSILSPRHWLGVMGLGTLLTA